MLFLEPEKVLVKGVAGDSIYAKEHPGTGKKVSSIYFQ